MEQVKNEREEKSETKQNVSNEGTLKIEFLRMQFCVEVLSDLIAFQKRGEQEWEKTEKLIRDRKRKKRRSKWEAKNGAEHKENK